MMTTALASSVALGGVLGPDEAKAALPREQNSSERHRQQAERGKSQEQRQREAWAQHEKDSANSKDVSTQSWVPCALVPAAVVALGGIALRRRSSRVTAELDDVHTDARDRERELARQDRAADRAEGKRRH